MIEISLNKVNKTYGFNNVLEDFNLEIKENEIVALIGENGCGKSTILKIICGNEYIDSGTVSIRKNQVVGYLSQEIARKDNILVKDYLYESIKDILIMEEKLEEYISKMGVLTGNDLESIYKKYSSLQERFINSGGYEIRSKVDKIINGFKIEYLLNKKFNVLSGGEKRVVCLAAIMIKEPNILLLDEPTNDLDMDTLEWFEKYLKKYNGTVLIVSHDRYFLDSVVTKTVLIERGKAHIFHGNYTYYIKENEERIER